MLLWKLVDKENLTPFIAFTKVNWNQLENCKGKEQNLTKLTCKKS